MSELRTNRIIPRDGLPSGSSGGIIQVRSTSFTGDWSGNSGGTNFDIITDLNTTITPTRSDSKILIMVTIGGWDSTGQNQRGALRLQRDNTPIFVNTQSTGSQTSASVGVLGGNSNNINQGGLSIIHMDSPSTTSAVTYKIGSATEGSYTTYINRSSGNASSSSVFKAASSMTLMEISG